MFSLRDSFFVPFIKIKKNSPVLLLQKSNTTMYSNIGLNFCWTFPLRSAVPIKKNFTKKFYRNLTNSNHPMKRGWGGIVMQTMLKCRDNILMPPTQ